MHVTAAAITLAKDVLEIAFADSQVRIIGHKRLSRDIVKNNHQVESRQSRDNDNADETHRRDVPVEPSDAIHGATLTTPERPARPSMAGRSSPREPVARKRGNSPP